jgi:hypothetical protein
MKKQLAIFRCTLLILCLMISLPASAADIAASNPGSESPLYKNLLFYEDSYYELVSSPGTSWDGAKALAEAAVLESCTAHLVTITSAGEQAALVAFFEGALMGKYYGGYQNPPGETDPAAGWTWVTGEPWVYTNWGPGEPNDSGVPGSEQYLAGAGSAGYPWNDTSSNGGNGYVIEYDQCHRAFLPMILK